MSNEELAEAILATFNLINRTAPAFNDIMESLKMYLNHLLGEQDRRAGGGK
jgi:hypothetical protein